MKEIFFTPKGFQTGASYTAELLFNNAVVDSKSNLVEFQQYSFEVYVPGTYTLRIKRVNDNFCLFTMVVQALFPLVEYNESGVDCSNNTYNISLNLTNPLTAGVNIQFGWSLLNDCSTVTNWSSSTNLILPADDIIRYVFVKNQDQTCCNFILQSSESGCLVCNLDVINVVFSCNG